MLPWRIGRLVDPDVGVKSLVEAVLQDRGDRAVGAGADAEAAQAGGLEADASVALGQPQDAERGAEALLGVRLGAQDRLDQLGGGGPIAAASRMRRCGVHSA